MQGVFYSPLKSNANIHIQYDGTNITQDIYFDNSRVIATGLENNPRTASCNLWRKITNFTP